tara:strand:+ start:1583 stop:1864 length:282 start_codon:yes stop_codon:yes gene_type:complete
MRVHTKNPYGKVFHGEELLPKLPSHNIRVVLANHNKLNMNEPRKSFGVSRLSPVQTADKVIYNSPEYNTEFYDSLSGLVSLVREEYDKNEATR